MKKLLLALVITCVALAAFALKSGTPWPQPTKHIGHRAPGVHFYAPVPRHSLDDVFSNYDTLRIPDFPGDTAVSQLTIPYNTRINDINVYVNIQHPWIRDLYISISAPGDTTRVVLLNYLRRDDAVNLVGWFNDQAAVSIMDADTPLVGEWQPLEPLTAFDGLFPQGTWTLRVYDHFAIDSGYVAMWSVEVNGLFNFQGIVRNAETGLPLPGVRLQLQSTNLITYTLNDGSFGLARVPTGTYTAQFSKALYDTFFLPDLALDSTRTIRRNDIVLQTIQGYHEFASSASPVDIPDNDTLGVTMSLTALDSALIRDIAVLVNIQHPYDADLMLTLFSPVGDSVNLASHVGGTGANFVNCRFSDTAAVAITQGTPPFAGNFRPAQQLSRFTNHQMAGTWSLKVTDLGPGDVGQIQNFTLLITEQPLSAAPRTISPAEFSFAGNYPNPFNSVTMFRFSVPAAANVRLVLFNVMGQEVARVFDGKVTAGEHTVPFDASRLASGVYFARLRAARQVAVQKVLLLR